MSKSPGSACGARRERAVGGFTLIELLIVIAIIGILAALLFPVFGRVKANGYRVQCLGNMKQLGLAITQYTTDHDGRLPGATDGTAGQGDPGGWMYYSVFGNGTAPNPDGLFDVTRGSIYSYVKDKNVYICPIDDTADTTGNSYAINGCLSIQTRNPTTGVRDYSTGYSKGKKLANIDKHSQWMLLGEEARTAGLTGTAPNPRPQNYTTDDGYINLKTTNTDTSTPPRFAPDPATPDYQNYFAPRHREFGNVLFLDGHVKNLTPERSLEQKVQIGGEGDLGNGCPM